MSPKQWRARAEAWDECAEHMRQPWTENKDEWGERFMVENECRNKAEQCRQIADEKEAK